MSLISKTKNAVKWSLISTFGSMTLQFAFGVVMARLLSPEDFGLMGIAMVFIAISKSIIDSGFYQALIQKKDVSENEFSAVFKFNIYFSTVLALIIYLSANRLAVFFNNIQLKEIIEVLTILLIVESFSLLQRAKLIKNIQFNLIAKVEITSILIGGIVGVYLAYHNHGVYSLVYKSIISSIIITSLFWVFNPVRINLKASLRELKSLFSFGIRIFLADQIESIANQVTSILIGKKFSAADLGYYSKSKQYQQIISHTVLIGINKVVFPTFAKIQDDNAKLKGGYKFLIKTTMFFIFPLMFLAILVADYLIPFLIGDQWLKSIFYFKLLCIGGMIYPFTLYNLNIIKVKGLSSLYLKIAGITKSLLIPAILIGIQFGIIGLIISVLIQQGISAIINSRYSGELINYKLKEQVKDVSLYFTGSLLVFIVGYSFINLFKFTTHTDFLMLLIYGIGFLITYLAIICLFGKDELHGFLLMMKRR